MAEISVRKFNIEDLDRYIEMSKSEYGNQQTTSNKEHIRWKHLESPFGPSDYATVVKDGKIWGRALIQQRPVESKEKIIPAGTVADVLLDRSYRTTPVHFMNLTKACDKEAGLLIHTANEKTNLLYKKVFKFPTPFSLKAYGFPVKLTGFLNKFLGINLSLLEWLLNPCRWVLLALSKLFTKISRLKISSNPITPDELKEFINRISTKNVKMFTRNSEYLKWRYADAPIWKSEVFRIDCSNQFYGYMVTRKIELDNLNYLVLMDYVVDPTISNTKKFTLRFWLIKQAIEKKLDGFFTMVNQHSPIALTCVGFPFVAIPDQHLPHSTPIFIRTNNNDLKENETSKLFHITLGDLDYF